MNIPSNTYNDRINDSYEKIERLQLRTSDREKKSKRRFLIGTLIGVSGLIIGVVGVVVGVVL